MTLLEDGGSERAPRPRSRHGSRLRFEPSGTAVRVPPGRDRLRRRLLERHRDRLDLRRSRHLQEVPRPDRRRRRRRPRRSTRGRSRRRSSRAAGGLPAARRRTSDLVVEVPPLVTRPKAATVGVGRQVILHPALQKRYVELDEPALHDQRSDFERAAGRDRRPRAARRPRRAPPAAARPARRRTSRSRPSSSTTC